MATSGPELDLELLTKTKVNVEVPNGIHTPMCFCGDSCKVVRCKVLEYAYGMRFFMCANYAHLWNNTSVETSCAYDNRHFLTRCRSDPIHFIRRFRWGRKEDSQRLYRRS
jgi:hypothetical protein